MESKETVRINTTAVDTDQLDDLAKIIGRIAVDAFSDPDIRKQFEEWQKRREVEGYDISRQATARHRCEGRDR